MADLRTHRERFNEATARCEDLTERLSALVDSKFMATPGAPEGGHVHIAETVERHLRTLVEIAEEAMKVLSKGTA